MHSGTLSMRSLRYLVAVADTSSVTGAARLLNVSQPSISAAVAGLEAELGVALLLRHHARGVTLTAAGAKIVMEARRLLNHADDFIDQANSLGKEVTGEVAMGWFQTLAPRYLPALIAALRRDLPRVTLRVEEGDHAMVMEGIVNGRSELALSYHFEVPAGLDVTPVADLAPVAVLPADHRLARAGRTSLALLIDEPYLLLDLPYSRDYFAGLFKSAGLVPRIGFRSRSQDLLRGLIGHGLGWTIQNVRPERPFATDGSRIAAVALEEGLEPVRLILVSAPGPARRPAVRAVAQYLAAAFRPGGLFQARPPAAVLAGETR